MGDDEVVPLEQVQELIQAQRELRRTYEEIIERQREEIESLKSPSSFKHDPDKKFR